jgi:hypothetical protein
VAFVNTPGHILRNLGKNELELRSVYWSSSNLRMFRAVFTMTMDIKKKSVQGPKIQCMCVCESVLVYKHISVGKNIIKNPQQ